MMRYLLACPREESKPLRFLFSKLAWRFGFCQLLFADKKANDKNGIDPGGSVSTEICRFNDILPKSAEPVALLKIDVEGFALPVLLEADESLKKHARNVGYSSSDIISFLVARHFSVCRREQSCWTPVKAGYCSYNFENLLALKGAGSVRTVPL